MPRDLAHGPNVCRILTEREERRAAKVVKARRLEHRQPRSWTEDCRDSTESKRGDTEQPPPHHCMHHTILIIVRPETAVRPLTRSPWSGFERFVLVGQG
jgi:hypothetical protein